MHSSRELLGPRLPRDMGSSETQISIREAIRNAARTLFADLGFHGVSVRKLAAAVGVHAGSMYCHFETKQEVLAELIEDYEENLELAINRGLKSNRQAFGIETYITASIMFNHENRESARLAFYEARFLPHPLRDAIEQVRRRRRAVLAELIEHHGHFCLERSAAVATLVESIIQTSIALSECSKSSIEEHSGMTCNMVYCLLETSKAYAESHKFSKRAQ